MLLLVVLPSFELPLPLVFSSSVASFRPLVLLIMSVSAAQLNVLIIEHLSEQYAKLQEDPRIVGESTEGWEEWCKEMGVLQVRNRDPPSSSLLLNPRFRLGLLHIPEHRPRRTTMSSNTSSSASCLLNQNVGLHWKLFLLRPAPLLSTLLAATCSCPGERPHPRPLFLPLTPLPLFLIRRALPTML